MKLGVISDIHGNLPALEAVLTEFEDHEVDEFVCAGDIIGVLGSPAEVASLIKEHAAHTILGNHDLRVSPDRDWMPVRDFEVVEYEQTLEDLDNETYEWLISLPGMIHRPDGIVITHSTPNPESPSGTERGDAGVHPRDFTRIATRLEEDILILGHTHYQHAVDLNRFDGQQGLVMNPGSVGFPVSTRTERDDDGRLTHYGIASFGIINTDTQEFELKTVEYDSTSVVEHLKEHGLDSPEGR
jgi:predicted phosphodiesterase